MKKQRNEDSTTYTIESPSEIGLQIAEGIFKTMADNNTQPGDVLPVLGEAVVRFLVMIAEPIGYDRNEIVNIFGEGIVNAKIEFKSKDYGNN